MLVGLLPPVESRTRQSSGAVRFVAAVTLGAAIAFLPAGPGRCDAPATPSPDQTPSPAPLAPYFSAEEEVSPTYDATTGSSTQLNLRGQLPLAIDGGQYVLRIKLPLVTSSPANSVTGAGDLQLFGLAVRYAAGGRWLEGVTIRVPTGQDDSLGTGKYSLGPAVGYQTQSGPWTLGLFTQSFFSVAGPSWRTGVGQTKVDPNVTYGLVNGWSVGLSTMSFTYDWVRNQWIGVPVGFRIEKALNGPRPFTAIFEYERNLVAAPDTPNLTLRLLGQWTFSR